MKWEKRGLIYYPPFDGSWKDNSALTPTPLLITEDLLRVYCGFMDKLGVSRIGYVDIDPNNPTKIQKISNKPVLDIGQPGNFDDNGVILGDVIRVGNQIFMYYVGFQIVNKVKFLAFTGLAKSEDNGCTFVRVQNTPILDRCKNSTFFNAIHSVHYESGKFKFWLGAGSSWQSIGKKYYPSYNVKYVESENGENFTSRSKDCLSFSRREEYRIGRPRVWKDASCYKMIFTWGDIHGNYQMGYGESNDGVCWDRKDGKLNFLPSDGSNWDSESVSYGAPAFTNGETLMFYNGNNMGYDGFGLATLEY
jgi:predicted GH43/DUF377 family glycosyl hydrolase